jgi:hypothetical protein
MSRTIFSKVCFLLVCLLFPILSASTALAQVDFEVVSINSPSPAATVYTSNPTVTVTVRNNSIYSGKRGIELSLSVDGQFVGRFIDTSTVFNAGSSQAISFPSSISPNLFKPGNRQLSVTVSHSGLSDPVMGNNTRMLTVVSAPPVASSAEVTGFPYAEDFEASDGNWTAFQYSADATANPMIFSRIAPTLADPEAYIVGAASGMQAWRTYTPTQAMTPILALTTKSATATQVVSPVLDLRTIGVAEVQLGVFLGN